MESVRVVLVTAGMLALRQLYQDRGYSVTDFVTAVLNIHSKYHNMVTSLFASHQDFCAALDRVSEGREGTIILYLLLYRLAEHL